MNCVSYAKLLFHERCIILLVCFSVVNVLIASSLKQVWNITDIKLNVWNGF